MISSSADIEMSQHRRPPPSSSSASFDLLKREATRLERHIEEKVGRYQQLSQRLSRAPPASHLDAESGSLLEGDVAAVLEEERVLAAEIERLISAMSERNDRMAAVAERSQRDQQTLLVRRYREILYDYSTDFKKIRGNLARKRDEAELFRTRSGTAKKEAGDEGMDHLLREKRAIGNSLLSATSVIGQAREIHGDLRTQRKMLHGVSGTVAGLTANVPGVNRLIDAIRKKKNKDNLIISGVIAACVLFTMWYLF